MLIVIVPVTGKGSGGWFSLKTATETTAIIVLSKLLENLFDFSCP